MNQRERQAIFSRKVKARDEDRHKKSMKKNKKHRFKTQKRSPTIREKDIRKDDINQYEKDSKIILRSHPKNPGKMIVERR